MIIFTLPLEPVAWGRVKRGSYGQAYVPAKTKRFERDVARLSKQFAPIKPLVGPLRVILRFVLKRPKRPKFDEPAVRPDIDNYCKSVFDGLNGLFWIDDAQITELNAAKLYDCSGCQPRIEVKIERTGETI